MRKFLLALILALAPSLAWAQAGTTNSQVSFTPSTGAYSAGQCVGPAGASAIMTVPGMVRVQGPGGTIVAQIDIVDTTGSNAAIDVLLFNALPTGTYTDQTNCIIAVADQPKLIGSISNTTFTCFKDQSSATGICQATPSVLMAAGVTPPKSNALWAVPIMRGTPTYGAAQTLYFNFKAFPD